MANLETTADLIADVLFRAREPTDGTSQYAAMALIYLNRAYMAIAAGGGELMPELREDWRWLRATTPGVLNLWPVIAPGIGTAPPSVDATFNHPALTFAGAIGEGLVSLAGWEIKIGTTPDIFRIVSHTVNTGIAVMDGPWTGPSGTYTYVVAQLEYTLPAGVGRVISPMRHFYDGDHLIHRVDRERLDGYHPLACAHGDLPHVFVALTEQRLRFDTYAPAPTIGGYETLYRLEYDYLHLPTLLTSPGTTEVPLIPQASRHVLTDWALFWLLMDKNDRRADATGQSARAGLMAMATENRAQRRSQDRSPHYGAMRPRKRYWL